MRTDRVALAFCLLFFPVSFPRFSAAGADADPAVVVAEGECFTPVGEGGWEVVHQDRSYSSHTYGGHALFAPPAAGSFSRDTRPLGTRVVLPVVPRVAFGHTTLRLFSLIAHHSFPRPPFTMSKHPNIIYILADDQGYGDVGCFNPNCKAPTPVLEGLAGEGMRFTDSHTSSAVCTPTRYSILTGRYNWRSRLKSGVLTGESPMLLESDRPTVASYLQDHGYWTACVGKWHLGLGWQTKGDETFSVEDQDWEGDVLERIDYSRPVTEGPNDFGFDYSFIIPSSLDIPPYVYLENGRPTGIPSEKTKIGVDTPYLMRRGMAVPGMKAENVLPTFRDKVLGVIRERSAEGGDQPFFIYFPLSAPHTPIVPTSEYCGRTDIGLYGDFVTQIDAFVGEVLACLQEEGLAEDTLVVFTSDNGASPAAKIDELKQMGHDPNYPWRGTKADIYEGGHRTPFIARWPGVIEPGSLCRQTICTTDLFATAISVVGGERPDGPQDSRDLTPLFRGEEIEGDFRDSTVHHSVSGHFAIRSGKWKLLEARGSGGWSFPQEGEAEEWGLPPYQLYDLEKDPGETTNLAEALPGKVDELRRKLDELRGED